MATSEPVGSGDTSSRYPVPSHEGEISTSNGKMSAKHLSPLSKCATVAFIVGGVAGIVVVILGAINFFGSVGSTGFIASIAGGGSVVVIGAVGLPWIIISNYKQSEANVADKPFKTEKGDHASEITGGTSPSSLPLIPFGAASWKNWWGVAVGEEPPLPRDIQTILNDACPYVRGKQVWQTHCLVLVPGALYDEPLTWPMLRNLVTNVKLQLGDSRIFDDPGAICIQRDEKETLESHWVLMLKEPIPGSCNEHKDRSLNPEKEEKYNYRMPYLQEAIVAILAHYSLTSERLFSKTEIYCNERGRLGNLRIGCFGEDGLQIRLHDEKWIVPNRGVGLLRVL